MVTKNSGRNRNNNQPTTDTAGVNPSEPTTAVINDCILREAAMAVHGQRQENYGGQLINFTNIADIWTVILKNKLQGGSDEADFITPQEVAMCLTAVKLARLIKTGGRHHDSIVDIAGYAECLAIINKQEGAEHF